MKYTSRTIFWLSVLGLVVVTDPASALVSSTCPQTSAPVSFTGTSLTNDCASNTSTACTTKAGTTVKSGGIQLNKSGTSFQTTSISITDKVSFSSPGDFNHDGWVDFVGTDITSGTTANTLKIYLNQTWQNETCPTAACTTYTTTPNWAVAITPKFIPSMNLHTAPNPTTYAGWSTVAAGDFNGDGWDDVAELFAADASPFGYFTKFNLYLNMAANSATGTGPNACTNAPVGGCAQFKNAYNAATATAMATLLNGSNLDVPRSTANFLPIDFNGDGRLDLLMGSGISNGTIHIFLGSCTLKSPAVIHNGLFECQTDPQFTDGGALITNLNKQGAATISDAFFTHKAGSVPVFRYMDFDGDGLKDLLVSSPDCGCATAAYRMRLFKGCPAPDMPSPGTCSSTKLETTASQYLNGVSSTTVAEGRATTILGDDFDLDGKPDVILGTDSFMGSSYGGDAYLWRNSGTTAPFSTDASNAAVYATQIATHGTGAGQSIDYDVGFSFDYDKDPDHTPDVLLADGNTTGAYYVLADRVSTNYVNCGDVASGVVDLGTLASSDIVVTSARITPTFTLPTGTTINFFMSNEDPASWVSASLCPSSTTDYCATFPRQVGRAIRWKATMCSNAAHTATPTITGVTMQYNYTQATEYYRSGVAVNDGVAYVGAYRQPGDRGRMYAVNAGFSTTYWEFGNKLDTGMSDGQRNIFTSLAGSRYPFTSANAGTSTPFRTLLAAPDFPTAQNVVNWVRSARFGLGTTSNPLTKLGSIVSSSAAILTKPGRPAWYSFAARAERGIIDLFVASNVTRVPLLLFGSKDGMIHAAYTFPSNMSDTRNGKEAWGYVPSSLASGLITDYTATAAANAAATDGVMHVVANNYPDASPTLLDYFNGTVMKTIALVSEGNGGRSFSVLDVTSTVDPVTGAVVGPTPMWTSIAGDATAGQAMTKPITARVQIGGAERFIAIAASGPDSTDPTWVTKGRIVAGYDLTTGTMLWKFQTQCTVTSQITAFETDDVLETPVPVIDGYIDRVVFADACGYVYKLNPAVDLAGAFLQNTGMGATLANTTSDGKKEYALFSTLAGTNLGAKRPIAGVIGARIDSTSRIVLYFGTGGIESVASTLPNHFYAVYADNGAVRSRLVGTCTAGLCEKFYGGMVVTPTQVIVTRTVDPQVATSTCDVGSSTITAFAIDSFAVDFSQSVGSAVVGAVFGDAGALYFATLSGDLNRLGTPRPGADVAGGDTAAGTPQGTGVGINGSVQGNADAAPMTLMGWRVVL